MNVSFPRIKMLTLDISMKEFLMSCDQCLHCLQQSELSIKLCFIVWVSRISLTNSAIEGILYVGSVFLFDSWQPMPLRRNIILSVAYLQLSSLSRSPSISLLLLSLYLFSSLSLIELLPV